MIIEKFAAIALFDLLELSLASDITPRRGNSNQEFPYLAESKARSYILMKSLALPSKLKSDNTLFLPFDPQQGWILKRSPKYCFS